MSMQEVSSNEGQQPRRTSLLSSKSTIIDAAITEGVAIFPGIASGGWGRVFDAPASLAPQVAQEPGLGGLRPSHPMPNPNLCPE